MPPGHRSMDATAPSRTRIFHLRAADAEAHRGVPEAGVQAELGVAVRARLHGWPIDDGCPLAQVSVRDGGGKSGALLQASRTALAFHCRDRRIAHRYCSLAVCVSKLQKTRKSGCHPAGASCSASTVYFVAALVRRAAYSAPRCRVSRPPRDRCAKRRGVLRCPCCTVPCARRRFRRQVGSAPTTQRSPTHEPRFCAKSKSRFA